MRRSVHRHDCRAGASTLPAAIAAQARVRGRAAGCRPVSAAAVRAAANPSPPLTDDGLSAGTAALGRPFRPRRAEPRSRLLRGDGPRQGRLDVRRARRQRPQPSRCRAADPCLLRRDRRVHSGGAVTVPAERRQLAPRPSLLLRWERSCDVDRQRDAAGAVLRAHPPTPRAAGTRSRRARRVGNRRDPLGLSGRLPGLPRRRRVRAAARDHGSSASAVGRGRRSPPRRRRDLKRQVLDPDAFDCPPR